MVYDTGRTNPVPTNTTRPAGEFGCIGERTCNSCGAVVGDSICMCMGIFTCPRCDKENDQSFLGKYTVISDAALNDIYIGLGISNMTWLRPDIVSATTAIIPEPDIGDMMSYDEWYGWEKTEDKKRCMGIFLRRESPDSALIRLITPSEKAFLGAEVGNLAEELVAYRDKVNRLKKKYQSRISSLIDKELEEFKKEFGQFPQGISVYSIKVIELGDEAPYHLNITTDINVGL